jgi:hypothetical protein
VGGQEEHPAAGTLAAADQAIAGLARRVAAASASWASRTPVAFPRLRVVTVIAWPFQPSSW